MAGRQHGACRRRVLGLGDCGCERRAAVLSVDPGRVLAVLRPGHEFGADSDEFLATVTGATGVPFLDENRLAILNNGDEFYPAMLDEIDTAEAPGVECVVSREELVMQLQQDFERDVAVADRVNLEAWRHRGIVARARELLAALLHDQV